MWAFILLIIVAFFLLDIVQCSSVIWHDHSVVAGTVVAPMIPSRMVELAVFEKLQGSLVDWHHIVDDLPEHALDAGWTCEAATVEPTSVKVDK